jgi:hypothetical protein
LIDHLKGSCIATAEENAMTVWLRCRIAFIQTIAAFAFMTVVLHAGAESALKTIVAMGDYPSSAVRLLSDAQAHVDKVEPKSPIKARGQVLNYHC